jgi:hypothetical protein
VGGMGANVAKVWSTWLPSSSTSMPRSRLLSARHAGGLVPACRCAVTFLRAVACRCGAWPEGPVGLLGDGRLAAAGLAAWEEEGKEAGWEKGRRGASGLLGSKPRRWHSRSKHAFAFKNCGQRPGACVNQQGHQTCTQQHPAAVRAQCRRGCCTHLAPQLWIPPGRSRQL